MYSFYCVEYITRQLLIHCPSTSPTIASPEHPIEDIFPFRARRVVSETNLPQCKQPCCIALPPSRRVFVVFSCIYTLYLYLANLRLQYVHICQAALQYLYSHSVPSMQFQVLLTRLSAFFSTFLRSTFPLSVFVSYLEFRRNLPPALRWIHNQRDSKAMEIRRPGVWNWQGSITLSAAAFQLTFQSTKKPPNHSLKRSIGLTVVFSRQTLFLWSVRSSFATTRRIIFIFFSSA